MIRGGSPRRPRGASLERKSGVGGDRALQCFKSCARTANLNSVRSHAGRRAQARHPAEQPGRDVRFPCPSEAEFNAKPKWNQVSLLGDYSLSKRTDVYLEGIYQRVNGANGTVLNGALINGIGTQSATNTQVAVTAGIRTRF
jgi:hypothetical protein